MVYTLVIVLHILVSFFLVATILFQTGKGMGAGFGGGTQAVFGGSGPASLLMKITIACATIFMLSSLYLTYVSGHAGSRSLMKSATPVIKQVTPEEATQPAAEATAKPETKAKKAAPAPKK